ncbi:MAG: LLM class flavin-dependent oxidoreductase [Chloroflexota bacterium]|nr:LLM class flavin-dependent oxidoreductase [Chloroflexota bacterium]
MDYGIHVQNSGEYGDPRLLAELARDAEQAGWDGFFIWDHLVYALNQTVPVADPVVALAAIAGSTHRVRFGPLVTPLARRRPWKLARETVSLDTLSNGRFVLGVGLGEPADVEFSRFGEEADAKVRAGKLDESLDILSGLWTGEAFRYRGAHYRVEEVTFLPSPVQSPRIPIWVAGEWPNKPPFRRAARWDGIFPSKRGVAVDEMMSPGDLEEIVRFIKQERSVDDPFVVALGGYTPAHDQRKAVAIVDPYIDVGLTWWLEGINSLRGSMGEARERIRQGPPKR